MVFQKLRDQGKMVKMKKYKVAKYDLGYNPQDESNSLAAEWNQENWMTYQFWRKFFEQLNGLRLLLNQYTRRVLSFPRLLLRMDPVEMMNICIEFQMQHHVTRLKSNGEELGWKWEVAIITKTPPTLMLTPALTQNPTQTPTIILTLTITLTLNSTPTLNTTLMLIRTLTITLTLTMTQNLIYTPLNPNPYW